MKLLFKSTTPVSLAILFAISLFWVYVCSTLLAWDPSTGWIAHSYSVWGDWSAHLTFINAFRERGLGWVSGASPLFSEAPFQYPFLSHWITAIFCDLLHLDSLTGAFVLSLGLISILPFALFRFFKSLSLTPVASLYSTLAFLLIGGFQIFDSSLNSAEPLTNQFSAGSVFTQFVLFEFFPQRAFLFGLVIFLLGFASLFQPGAEKGKSFLSRELPAGLMFAVLSLVHLHSFIAMGVLLIGMLSVSEKDQSILGSRKKVLTFGVSVAAAALPALMFLLLRHNEHPFLWELWSPGWAQNQDAHLEKANEMNPIWFWVYNTGLFLPLCILGVTLHLRQAKPFPQKIRAVLASGAFLFLIAILFKIQPSFYDNLKVFTYAFLLLAPALGLALEWIHQRFMPLALALLCIQCASATRDCISFAEGFQSAVFFSPSEVDLAREFKKIRKSQSDLVLITPKHNHWVPCLSASPIVMGYPGWLWSWGISYGEMEKKIAQVLLGGPDAVQVIDSLKVKYIIIERGEKILNQPVQENFLNTHFERILERDNWIIYSATSRLKSPS